MHTVLVLWNESIHCLFLHVRYHKTLVFCLQFQAHAVADGSGNAEQPMDIVVNVIDQNDNRPTFEKDTFLGEVPEASPKSTVFKTHLTPFKISETSCQNYYCL